MRIRNSWVPGTVGLVLAALAGTAHAQHISGSFSASNAAGSASITFECTGNDPCVGTYRGTNTPSNCPPHAIGDRFIVTGGVTPATPRATALLMTLVNGDAHDPVPCQFVNPFDFSLPVAGQWDGLQGTFGADFDDPGGTIHLTGHYSLDDPPPFQIAVASTINDTTASSTATVQFPDAVVGTSQSVYIFALAPPSLVKRGTAKDDATLPCVLAQLNSAGQLVSVSAASLQAYVSGVIAAGNQAYTILNGVPTVNIGGATFFLGYGSSPTSMISGGTNRAAVSVPAASASCKAEKPDTGWWWNEKEGGRGFSIEARNGNLFFAGYLYDGNGQATWVAASGRTALEGSVFQSDLLAFANGQTLAGNFKAPQLQASPGPVTLTFSDRSHAVLSWPGGNIALQRFELVPNGLAAKPVANQPESGWWWNEAESGRGFFIEWQGTTAFLATYMYTASGTPIWYSAFTATPDILSLSGTLQQYSNGQTLTGTYHAPTLPPADIGPVSVTFSAFDTAVITLPGGRQVPIKRFRF